MSHKENKICVNSYDLFNNILDKSFFKFFDKFKICKQYGYCSSNIFKTEYITFVILILFLIQLVHFIDILKIVSTLPLTYLVKDSIIRQRPYITYKKIALDRNTLHEPCGSFYSSHTAVVSCIAFVLYNNTGEIIIPLILVPAIILSRCWARMHWLTDTIVGAIIGFGFANIC